MQSNSGNLSQAQLDLITAALVALADAEIDVVLEDLKFLYFKALENNLMDDSVLRSEKTFSFIQLHDFIAKVNMIYNKNESCHLLAV
ncbi:hypothetical protein M1M27_gp46 [Cellulophaga phage Ingeline_1]|uniref:Uncharacterized protein n=1 Tax=Cellulophaga phage Ingeline_1 TaxID=2745674 RepID=A0A8E4ZL62_9CAUD|nr:hypothetical protein M1M27_gp46 [Cellulophaga phage Ingeline_1]QQV90039.1 hypothetical protein Ingeline2_5 [Cellulophaga phage Ingeline_2]QQV90089.1 hypothetical protein Ingeline3_5 [Cellulophaga phage Ingeline_3]QQV90139.1 hypothetical protein Ingeline4_5 [Cellulophaga phage Ingeline_4]QQV90189.1 hypothetical protein Ingeline5_5 [Cellulophaga phage Ingeline_5]QQV90238.1 hypothetical protein Ingeline6_5 [Cellulophaga phage Ingeline_6]QQV90288.1 hypothetical protein Ingeline7_5 [Cellulophag